MDARAVATAADLGVNTLNVWVARGLVPGMTIGARGLQRNFDLKIATAIIIMAELTRFGLSALLASAVASEAMGRNAKLLLITRPPSSGKLTNTRTAYLDSEGELVEMLDQLRALAIKQRGPRPSVFVLVDLETLAARMRAADDEWKREQKPPRRRKAK